jgi:Cu+-exporting ATPase
MAVDPEATPHRTSLDGRDYYFCSHACRLDFEEDPAAYLPGDAEAAG